MTHLLHKCVFLFVIGFFVSDAFSGTVTRSCSSRTEIKYHYYDQPPVTGFLNHKPVLADEWVATTGWGYTRSSSSSGWIPSPSAARERACKASALARSDKWTVSKIDDVINKVCARHDYLGTIEILKIRAQGSSDGYSYSNYLRLDSYREFDYKKNIKYYNCEEGELFDGWPPPPEYSGGLGGKSVGAIRGCISPLPCR